MCISVVDEPGAISNADSLARMEFYMKKAAQEEKIRQPKYSKDEMPPPASLQGSILLLFVAGYSLVLHMFSQTNSFTQLSFS